MRRRRHFLAKDLAKIDRALQRLSELRDAYDRERDHEKRRRLCLQFSRAADRLIEVGSTLCCLYEALDWHAHADADDDAARIETFRESA